MRWQINQTKPGHIIQSILAARGLTSASTIHAFLHPKNPLNLTPESVGLDRHVLSAVVSRLKLAIQVNQPILIYGDYDADGVNATAILWETLHTMGAMVYPFIPSRETHGYGLSIKGITDTFKQYSSLFTAHRPLVITVDNGITAVAAAQHLMDQGVDLIITDHHE